MNFVDRNRSMGSCVLVCIRACVSAGVCLFAYYICACVPVWLPVSEHVCMRTSMHAIVEYNVCKHYLKLSTAEIVRQMFLEIAFHNKQLLSTSPPIPPSLSPPLPRPHIDPSPRPPSHQPITFPSTPMLPQTGTGRVCRYQTPGVSASSKVPWRAPGPDAERQATP